MNQSLPGAVRAAGRICRYLLAALLSATVLACSAPAVEPDTEALTIHTTAGERIEYRVEIADSDSSRRQGLMHRRFLAADHGMLFLYRQPHTVNMWMMNTFIPLDILFIDTQGIVVAIAAMAEPHSTRLIPSGQPVRAVLEINGGQARARGIDIGARVQHGSFTDSPSDGPG